MRCLFEAARVSTLLKQALHAPKHPGPLNDTHTNKKHNNPGSVHVFMWVCVCVFVEEGRGGGGVNVRGWYPCAVMSGEAADTTMIIQDQFDLEQRH